MKQEPRIKKQDNILLPIFDSCCEFIGGLN